MSRSLLIFMLLVIIIAGQAQDYSKLLPEAPARNSKENTKYLVSGIALEKRAWSEYRKEMRKCKVSLNLEPTNYGIGIVCRI
jgi:hypothetical protein